MSEKLIVSWDEYNKTVEKLAIQIHESGYKLFIDMTSTNSHSKSLSAAKTKTR